jgi:hypothetical protein
MKLNILPLAAAAAIFSGCQTSYQSEAFTGGYRDFMTSANTAVITCKGNPLTDPTKITLMADLRAAELTLSHGFRYFIITDAHDISTDASFTMPGYAYTSAYGGWNSIYATTTYQPAQNVNLHRAGVLLGIAMSNNAAQLVRYGSGRSPIDAAFIQPQLRQYLGLKN